jgi:hypothetical protein
MLVINDFNYCKIEHLYLIFFIKLLKKVSSFTDLILLQKKTPVIKTGVSQIIFKHYSTVCVWFLKTNFPSKASIKIILSVVIFPASISLDN